MTDLTSLERAVAELDGDELASKRWFSGKGRLLAAVALVDAVRVPGSGGALLVVVDVEYESGAGERYLLPARLSHGELGEVLPGDPLWPALAKLLTGEAELPGLDGVFATTPGLLEVGGHTGGRALTDDQSNTSIVLGDELVVKCYRLLLPGTHPEPELLSALSRVGSHRAPRFGGALVRRSGSGEEALACAYAFVSGEPVGWERLILRLRDALSRDDAAALDDLIDSARELGAAVAELHVDLSRAFGVGVASVDDAQRALDEARAQLDEARSAAAGDLATAFASAGDGLDEALDDLSLLAGAPMTRCHGDLHVAQFVAAQRGLVVVDFEGQPGRPLADRRLPGTPLRDLACFLLSLDHVAVAAARRLSFGPALDAALAWSTNARGAAIEAYRSGVTGSGLIVDEQLLRALEVEKECHEAVYASTVLPEWSYAPALVLPRLVGGSAGEEA